MVNNKNALVKKKILYIVTSLGTGGIMRSLQNFLNQYDTGLYDVDVFAMVHQGLYKGELDNCNLLPCNRILNASLARFEKQHGWNRIASLLTKILNKVTKYRFQQSVFYIVSNNLSKRKHYDAVIAFSEGVPTAFVACMNHPNKIGWIHCDYDSYYQLNHKKTEKEIYHALKSIVCVSNFTKTSFLHYFPELVDRTYSVYNVLDAEMMKTKSVQSLDVPFDKNKFKIVSIGRIDPVKRLSVIPELARKVVDEDCDIQWYVIGPKGTNEEYNMLLQNIGKYEVRHVVSVLGELSNPYPYIANADLLVNTSVSEACPYVINEAKILHTPIVCTDFGSAKEFVENDVNGYSVPIEQVPQFIVSLIKDRAKLLRLKENLSHFRYDNETILQQIYDLI